MVLTPLAETLVEPVRDLLLQTRQTLATKPRFDPATATRHISIAVSDYTIEILLSDVLRRARVLAPFITFRLQPVGNRASEALDAGELDFLIAPMHLSSAHPTEVLFKDTWTCIAWTGNHSIGESFSLDHYLNFGHVVVQIGENIMHDEHALRRFNYRRRVELTVPSFHLAPSLIVGTERIATVKTRLALKSQSVLPIRLLPLPFEMAPVVETLQWHSIHDHDPLNKGSAACYRKPSPNWDWRISRSVPSPARAPQPVHRANSDRARSLVPCRVR